MASKKKSYTRYWKTIVAALIPLTAIAVEALQAYENGAADGTFDNADKVKILVAIIGAFGVYAKANTTTDPVVAATQSAVLDASVLKETKRKQEAQTSGVKVRPTATTVQGGTVEHAKTHGIDLSTTVHEGKRRAMDFPTNPPAPR
jgi:hypothetical protein